ncbi:MAG TPA: hypothetical protein PLF25_00100 [Accumulibacter sp.]|nr:hypothetical protein [Accumulibacter sp.]
MLRKQRGLPINLAKSFSPFCRRRTFFDDGIRWSVSLSLGVDFVMPLRAPLVREHFLS